MSSSEKKKQKFYKYVCAWIANGKVHISTKEIIQDDKEESTGKVFTMDLGKVLSSVSNGNDEINPEVTIATEFTKRKMNVQELLARYIKLLNEAQEAATTLEEILARYIKLLNEALPPATPPRENYIIDGEETPRRSSCNKQVRQSQVSSTDSEALTSAFPYGRDEYKIDGAESPRGSLCTEQTQQTPFPSNDVKVSKDRSRNQIFVRQSENHNSQIEAKSEAVKYSPLKYENHKPNNEHRGRKLSGINDISISARGRARSEEEQQFAPEFIQDLINKSHTMRKVDEKSCGDAFRNKSPHHDTTSKYSMALLSTSTDKEREAPGGEEDTNRSSGNHTNIERQGGRQDTSSSQHQPFMKFWNLDFGGESRQCLSVALEEPSKTEPGIQSTMFLLDTSESMRENDIKGMKGFVQQILNDADIVREADRDRDAKEAFGLAVFGRDTKIMQAPTTDYTRIKNCLDTLQTGGRSPLGLGMILCISVWFGYQGLQGTVWIHGRKVHPKIILITDMKPNETVSNYNGGSEYENDDLENISQVNVELYTIAVRLGKLQIPVFMIPVGKNQEHYKKNMEPIILKTGGCVIDPRERVNLLGRQAYYQRLACMALQQLGNDAMQNEGHGLVEAITPYGNEEDRREVMKIITDRSRYETNGVIPIPVQVNIAGEPGEQFWGELPLGTRVQCPSESSSRVGTVVAHAPNFHIIVYWDRGEQSSFEIDQLRSVQLYRRPKISRNQRIQLHIGCKVRRVDRSEDSMSEGTVIGVATLQNNVLYVGWSDGNVGRHSFPDQIEKCEQETTWYHCINGDLQPFGPECNNILEDAYIAESKTKLLCFEDKQYRAIFRRKKIRQLFPPHDEFDLVRDPP